MGKAGGQLDALCDLTLNVFEGAETRPFIDDETETVHWAGLYACGQSVVVSESVEDTEAALEQAIERGIRFVQPNALLVTILALRLLKQHEPELYQQTLQGTVASVVATHLRTASEEIRQEESKRRQSYEALMRTAEKWTQPGVGNAGYHVPKLRRMPAQLSADTTGSDGKNNIPELLRRQVQD